MMTFPMKLDNPILMRLCCEKREKEKKERERKKEENDLNGSQPRRIIKPLRNQ